MSVQDAKILVTTRAKFLPRSRHDVCKILNLGEIVARYCPSRRDCRDLAMMFVILNLSEIAARYPPSHRDLTMMFGNF